MAIRLDKELEESNEKVIALSFCERVKLICKETYQGFKIRGLSRTLGIVLIMNILTPSFADFFYAYEVVVLKLEQVELANLLNFSLFIGIVFLVGYFALCTKVELRWALVTAITINVIG